jgi:hypothetical protein
MAQHSTKQDTGMVFRFKTVINVFGYSLLSGAL